MIYYTNNLDGNGISRLLSYERVSSDLHHRREGSQPGARNISHPCSRCQPVQVGGGGVREEGGECAVEQ